MTLHQYIRANPTDTDEQVLTAVNVPSYAAVSLADIERWTIVGDRRARLRLASANTHLPVEMREAIRDLLDALASPRLQSLDLTDAAIRTRWLQGAAALSQATVLTADEAAELSAFGVTTPAYTLADVASARADIARADLLEQVDAAYQRVQEAINGGDVSTFEDAWARGAS